MATRRTYYQRNQETTDEGGEAQPPPPPPPAGGGWLRTIGTIAVSAVVGAIAVDLYKRFFTKSRNPPEDEMMPPSIGPMGSLPGASSIMPMPLPLPMPWPMPMGFGQPMMQAAPAGYRDERPLTEQEKLEMERLKTERAIADAKRMEAEAERARWEAWENEDL